MSTRDQKEYDAIVVVTPADFDRLRPLHRRIAELLPVRRVVFVGSAEVGEHLDREIADGVFPGTLRERVGFLEEDSLLSFDAVQAVMESCADRPQGQVPRRATGWYYQQFLKFAYADRCTDEYYMAWDGDTVPCKPFSMFSDEGTPYLDYKREHHEEYFTTMRNLIGMFKVIEPSFISEHMLFRCDLVGDLIKRIEANAAVPGEVWWEKILRAVRPEKLLENSFSEFETYGTFVALTAPGAYRLREWHSFRYAAEFFEAERIGERDYEWLARDFTAASFEKNMSVREDHRNLFDNPEYQKKLSARQMLEAVQNEFEDGYLESWDLPAQVRKSDSPACLRYLSEKTYLEYEKLGDTLIGKNPDQAYLCYENAAFLAADPAEKKRLQEKKDEFARKNSVSVRKACILILSYNQKYMTEKCLESIRDNCDPGTHAIVILDNASTDGSAQWLSEYVEKHSDQDTDCEITLALSDENLGFPAGCNAASEYASPEEDIFLLNNDTRLPANALFWLRMGLYESETVGAVGAVQNYDANKDQHDDVERSLPEDYLEYGAQHNVYMEDPYVEKNKLSGFAMLIKHGLYHELGGFDERFSPGYFEDDDLCVRIRERGKKLMICRNAFIYHAGSQSFAKRPEAEKLVETNRRKFIEKWGYDIP